MKRFFSAVTVIIMILLISSCDNSVSEVITNHHKKTVSFSGITVVDNEICCFKAVEIDPNAEKGYTLNISFKNKTNNKNLMFSLNRVSVNGFMCDPYWGRMAAAGEELSDSVVWSNKLFELNSITEPTDIELTLRVYDYDNMGKKDYFTEQFVIFPNGQNKVQLYERVIDEDNTIIFDNDKCAMIVKGYEYNEKTGFTINAYLENKSDKNVIYTVEKATVNGVTVIPYWSCEVAEGKRANVGINWTPEQFEEEEIQGEISDIEFLMRVFDIESGTDMVHQTYIVSPGLKIQKK